MSPHQQYEGNASSYTLSSQRVSKPVKDISANNKNYVCLSPFLCLSQDLDVLKQEMNERFEQVMLGLSENSNQSPSELSVSNDASKKTVHRKQAASSKQIQN